MSVSTTKLKFRTIIEMMDSTKISDKMDKNITHTSMGEKSMDIYPGKYRIEKDKLEKFYELYTKWVFDYGEDYYLTEAHHPEDFHQDEDHDLDQDHDQHQREIYFHTQ